MLCKTMQVARYKYAADPYAIPGNALKAGEEVGLARIFP